MKENQKGIAELKNKIPLWNKWIGNTKKWVGLSWQGLQIPRMIGIKKSQNQVHCLKTDLCGSSLKSAVAADLFPGAWFIGNFSPREAVQCN